MTPPAPPTFLEYDGKDDHSNYFGRYRCQCGREFRALIGNVKAGHTKSCGCYQWATVPGLARYQHKEFQAVVISSAPIL